MLGTDIGERLSDAGRSQAALARHLGKSVHAINRLVRSGREVPSALALEIDRFFGPIETPVLVDRVPVYGYAASAGSDRVAIATDRVFETIEVPKGLVRGEVIGIRVPGDSMEPRLFSGEIVIVAVGVPPHRNGDCVVELNDSTAIVKQYRGQRDGTVFLHQFNPDQEVRVPGAQVKAIHAVLLRR